MIVAFILGYMAIALEHPIKIDKAASAVLLGVVCWVLFIIGGDTILAGNEHVAAMIESGPHEGTSGYIVEELVKALGGISQILFFLMGAMTIVELVDAHEGFKVITDKITSRNKVKLVWVIGFITFFLSAALDNLTTAIVMVSLVRKLVDDKADRWFFGGIIVIAANAGGAWSPIGDVTTTMLWIGGQITAGKIIVGVFLPSLLCLLAPLIFLSFKMKGELPAKLIEEETEHKINPVTDFERKLIFGLGIGGLLFVPVFKTLTHLPPFMGILFSLGVLWVVTEIIHRSKNTEEKAALSVVAMLRKIDTASILFFLGILLAVGSLEAAGQLTLAAQFLNDGIGNIYVINVAIGLLSAIVDNVPLVAASMGMYPVTDMAVNPELASFATDGAFWEMLAYCAGTGGSVLIIGSAAGVAVMGMEKIDFIWYFKNISLLALLGYAAGSLCYWLMSGVM